MFMAFLLCPARAADASDDAVDRTVNKDDRLHYIVPFSETISVDTLSAMRTYVAVADAGSFTGGADRLGVAKSRVTKQVAALERRLGVRLLNRTTRSLSRTEAGRAYYEQAKQLLDELDSLEHSVGDLVERPRGVLRITAPLSFGVLHLGGPLADYARRYPDVQLDVSLGDRVVDLVDEGFDMALRIGREIDPGLVARKLATTRMVLCASPGYLARHGTPRRLRDIAKHRSLAFTYSSLGGEWKAEGPQGPVAVRVPPAMRANNGDLIVAGALNDWGMILQPTFLVAEHLRAGRLVALLPRYRFPELGIFAVYPHRRYLSAKVRTMVDHLAATFAAGFSF
jgi:DNA-binding transcriptional LysR family regulator